jgi:acetyl esterase/lipase
MMVLCGACGIGISCNATSAPDRTGRESVPIITDCSIPAVPDASTVRLNLDVPVYTPEAAPQLLDIARPIAGGPHPLVVLVHGGGWFGGHQHEFVNEISQLASIGFVAASVSYRLAPAFMFPAPVSDVRCALQFLRAKRDSLGIDPSRVVLLGASAGGQLAALTSLAPEATQYDTGCPYRSQPVTVSGLVEYYGPLDLRQPADFPPAILDAIDDFLGAPAGSAAASEASPIVYAGPGDPPILMIHGTADDLIDIDQPRRVRAAFGSANVPATLVELPGVGHGFPVLSTQIPMRTASCTTLAFLKEYLRP